MFSFFFFFSSRRRHTRFSRDWSSDVCSSDLGEPGAERTSFPNARSGIGWEDDLETPRTAAELTEALQTTWEIIAGCLDRWTPDMLAEQFHRKVGERTQVHTRQSVLLRL